MLTENVSVTFLEEKGRYLSRGQLGIIRDRCTLLPLLKGKGAFSQKWDLYLDFSGPLDLELNILSVFFLMGPDSFPLKIHF